MVIDINKRRACQKRYNDKQKELKTERYIKNINRGYILTYIRRINKMINEMKNKNYYTDDLYDINDDSVFLSLDTIEDRKIYISCYHNIIRKEYNEFKEKYKPVKIVVYDSKLFI
jgi:hypothetical protein